jgi:hypothetical protein
MRYETSVKQKINRTPGIHISLDTCTVLTHDNLEALSRVRWVTEMQKPYPLFGGRI